MSEVEKYWKVNIKAGRPMELLEREPLDVQEDTEKVRESDQIRLTINKYLASLQELLNGQYHASKHLVPPYLSGPGNVVGICCSDGVLIRFDPKNGDRRTIVGRIECSLTELVEKFSEGVVHCHANRDFKPTPGVNVTVHSMSPTGEVGQELLNCSISYDVVLERPDNMPLAPRKPYCLVAVENSWEIQIQGEVLDEGLVKRQIRFRNAMRLGGIGWDCIQVFPFTRLDNWKPEYAPIWAELDIQAAIIANQGRQIAYQSLDPYAEAREQKRELLYQYEQLLNSNPEREETLQKFLEAHPALLSPTHIRCYPKLALGAHITDFVFQEPTGDYLLVELEKSTHELFLKGRRRTDATSELNHARSQICDWKRYLQDNLWTVQNELGLIGISSTPRSLIVIGRSAMLDVDQRRKLTAMESENPTTKILTYDDVVSS